MIILTQIFIYSMISMLSSELVAERLGDVRFVNTWVTIDIKQIPNTTSAMLYITVKEAAQHHLKFENWLPKKFHLQYWPLATDMLIHSDNNLELLCANSIDYATENAVREFEHCEADIFEFGFFEDSSMEPRLSRFLNRCKVNERNFSGDTTIQLDDLWPYAKYAFKVNVNKYGLLQNETELLEGPEPLTEYPFCTAKYFPLGPPQTDNSSFELDLQPDGYRNVTLYWRAVPHMFYGDYFLNITLNCTRDHDDEVFYQLMLPNELSKLRIPTLIPSNWSITCELRSLNSVGYSKGKSYIRIPTQKKVLKIPDTFVLEDVNFSKGYKVRWNDTVNPLASKTQFTLYWCFKKTDLECSGLKGIYRTLQKEQTVRKILSPNKDTFQYKFGIAFEYIDTGERSPIYWQRDCDLLEIRSLPLIITSTQALKVGTGLALSWKVGNCRKTPLIDVYEYNYCFLEIHHPCTSMVQFSKVSFKERVNFEDEKKCVKLAFNNQLEPKTEVHHLHSHSYYAIRLRYHIPNGHWSNWSAIEIGSTSYESSKSTECLTRIVTSVMILGPLITTLAYYLYRVYRHKILRPFSKRNRLKTAVATVPNQLVFTFEGQNRERNSDDDQDSVDSVASSEDDIYMKASEDFFPELLQNNNLFLMPYTMPDSMMMGTGDEEDSSNKTETINSIGEIRAT